MPAYNIGDAFFSVGVDLSGFRTGLRSADTALQAWLRSADGSTRSLSGSFLSLGDVIKGSLVGALAWRGFNEVLDGIGASLKVVSDGMINLNARLEQNTLGWTFLLKSGQRAQEMLLALQTIAARTPFLFPQMEQDARRLLAVGTAAKDVIPLLTDLGNVIAGLGGTRGQIDQLTATISRMIASSRVRARDLNDMAQLGIPSWNLLAQVTHRTTAQLQTDLRAGKVASREFVAAFQEWSRTNFADAMVKQSHTFLGALTTIKDNLQIFGSTAFKPVFDVISRLTDRLATFVQSDQFMDWAARIGAALSVVISNVSRMVGGFDGAFNAIASIVSNTGQIIYQALQWINPFARHSPSLVEQVSEGTNRIAASYAQLAPKIQSGLAPAIASIEAFKRLSAAGVAYTQRRLDQDTADTLSPLGAGVPASYLAAIQGLRTYQAELTRMQGAIRAQEAVVEGYRQRVHAAEQAIHGKEQALQAAERAMRPYEAALRSAQAAEEQVARATEQHRRALADLQEQQRTAQENLDRLSSTQVTGSTANADAAFANTTAQARVRDQLADLEHTETVRRRALTDQINAEEQAVKGWKDRVDEASRAVDTEQDTIRGMERTLATYDAAVKQAQTDVDAHKDAVERAKQAFDDITKAIETAQQAMQNWAKAPLQGERAFADRLFALDQQTAALQLKLTDLQIGNPNLEEQVKTLQDDLKRIGDQANLAGERLQTLQDEAALTGGNVSPELAARLAQAKSAYTGLQQAHADTANQLNQKQGPLDAIKALQQAIQNLDSQAERTRLEEKLQIEPLRHQLEALADTTKEVDFTTAANGIRDAQQQIATLTTALGPASDAWDREAQALTASENRLKTAQRARDNYAAAVDREKQHLEDLQDTQRKVQRSYDDEQGKLQDLQDAYNRTDPAIEKLRQQLEDLEYAGEKIDLARAINIDPLERQLDRIKNPIQELPFDVLAGKLRDAKGRVDDLTDRMKPLEQALRDDEKAQQAAHDATQAATDARDRQRDALDRQREAIDDMRSAMQPLQDALAAQNDVLQTQRDAYQEASSRANDYKKSIDDIVQAAQALAKLNQQDEDAIQSGGLAGIDEYLKNWADRLEALKARFAGYQKEYQQMWTDWGKTFHEWIDPVGDAFKKFSDWWGENVAPNFTWFSDWIDKHHDTITTAIWAFAGAFVGLNLALGITLALAGGIGAVIGALATPIGAIALIVAGFAAAYQTNFLHVRDATNAVWALLRDDVWPWLRDTFWPHLRDDVLVPIKNVAETSFEGWRKAMWATWVLLKDTIWPWIRDDFWPPLRDNVFKPLQEVAVGAFDGAQLAVRNFYNYLHDTVWPWLTNSFWPDMRDTVLHPFGNLWKTVFQDSQGHTTDLYTYLHNTFWPDVKTGTDNTKKDALEPLRSAWETAYTLNENSMLGVTKFLYTQAFAEGGLWAKMKAAMGVVRDEDVVLLAQAWGAAYMDMARGTLEGFKKIGEVIVAGMHPVDAFINGFRDAINWIYDKLHLGKPFSDAYQSNPIDTNWPDIPVMTVGHKATGGVIDTDLTVVGENGPELIRGGRGAYVYPTHDARTRMFIDAYRHGAGGASDLPAGAEMPAPWWDVSQKIGKYWVTPDLLHWIGNGADWLIDHALGKTHNTLPTSDGSILGDVMEQGKTFVRQGVVQKVNELFSNVVEAISKAFNGLFPPWFTFGGGAAAPGVTGTPNATGYVFPVQGYHGNIDLHWGSYPGAADIFAPRGTPILAMRGGHVDFAGFDASGGNAVLISGDDGLKFYYAHGNATPSVSAGRHVDTGVFLMPLGNTGNAASTDPHLHIGIGHRILTGTGPKGGAGEEGFDAVGLLRAVLAAGSGTTGPAPMPGAGQFWRDTTGAAKSWITTAIAQGGYPSDWGMPTSIIAWFESRDNPNAINLNDSNFVAGYPSRGIMQTIPQTFNQWRRASARPYLGNTGWAGGDLGDPGDIYNPIENIIAALEYIRRGKGTTPWNLRGVRNILGTGPEPGVYKGYANGGRITEEIWGVGTQTGTVYSFGEGNRPEWIIPERKTNTPAMYNTTSNSGTTIVFERGAVQVTGGGNLDAFEDALERATRRALDATGRRADIIRRMQ